MPALTAKARPDDAFSLDAYAALLGTLRERGYAPCSFETAEPSRPHLVLRHDVDISLEAALSVAELEHGLGIAATYFVLLRTALYNPMSDAGTKALRALAEQGHEIGLHFDAALYPDDDGALEDGAAGECETLERLTGRPVRIISFHRPARRLLGLVRPLAGRPHAYQPRYFSEMGYCSDSRGEWRHGHPLDHDAVRTGQALQLLTHPIWWVGEGSPQERLRSFLHARSRHLDLELAAQCDVHVPGGSDDDG